MIKFAHTIYFYLLLIIPVFILFFWINIRLKKNALKKFGDISIIKYLMPDISISRPIIKFIILIFAFFFMIVGIADPLVGSKLEKVKRKGVEIIIALDVSNSMMAEDIQPNRLERAKRAIAKLIDNFDDDKIGLIVFAGDAYTQLPITTDYVSAKLFLSTISTNSVPVQGTSIGKAIELAMKSFSSENNRKKALIIITDGENHEDDAVEMAQKATEKGIIVHTLGMGLAEGAPIPVLNKNNQKEYKTDKEGGVVVSKLDEKLLQQISSAGEGIYIRSNNSETGLNKLFDEISKMDKQEFESQIYSDYDHQFQYFIGFALFMLILELLILDRKNRFLKNINLFKKNY